MCGGLVTPGEEAGSRVPITTVKPCAKSHLFEAVRWMKLAVALPFTCVHSVAFGKGFAS